MVRDAFGGDNVLEGVRDAVQGTAILARGDVTLGVAGALHGVLWCHRGEALQARLQGVDPLQGSRDQFYW